MDFGFSIVLAAVLAQQPAEENKDAPRVAVCLPLGASAGATSQITLRGLKLDTATEVRFDLPGVTARIVSQAKADVPAKQDPARVGDTQLMLEVTLPADAPSGEATFTVAGPGGTSPPHKLLIDVPGDITAETEPNDGFRQAQAVEVGQVLAGDIRQPQDVDVFVLRGTPGEKMAVEVLAARLGAAVDAILTAYDARGRILASRDDEPDTTDCRLVFPLPADGTAHIALQDAHDQGGPAHVYRLRVERGE